jgi:hypothetical protein
MGSVVVMVLRAMVMARAREDQAAAGSNLLIPSKENFPFQWKQLKLWQVLATLIKLATN